MSSKHFGRKATFSMAALVVAAIAMSPGMANAGLKKKLKKALKPPHVQVMEAANNAVEKIAGDALPGHTLMSNIAMAGVDPVHAERCRFNLADCGGAFQTDKQLLDRDDNDQQQAPSTDSSGDSGGAGRVYIQNGSANVDGLIQQALEPRSVNDYAVRVGAGHAGIATNVPSRMNMVRLPGTAGLVMQAAGAYSNAPVSTVNEVNLGTAPARSAVAPTAAAASNRAPGASLQHLTEKSNQDKAREWLMER